MSKSADAAFTALDAYVESTEGDVPAGVSAPAHARLQAEILAEDLTRLEAKATAQTAEISGRLASLREHKAFAEAVNPGDYPQIAAAAAEIVRREAKAAAELAAIDTHLSNARDAAAAAVAEANRLEAETKEP